MHSAYNQAYLGTDFLPMENGGGNTIIRPTAQVQSIGLDFTGVARISRVILKSFGRLNGNTLRIICEFPAVPNIVVEFRNRTSSGSLILPTDRFPDGNYTTDGLIRIATFDFVLDGVSDEGELNWRYATAAIPA